MKALIATIFLAISSTVFAGKHSETKDDFTGKVSKSFDSTINEFAESNVFLAISYFNGRLILYAAPNNGVTNCDRSHMMLKTADGIIHTLRANIGSGHRSCAAYIQPEWIKDSFKVRIPMFSRSSMDASMDTSTLDLERLK
jgi:hypothetical protein